MIWIAHPGTQEGFLTMPGAHKKWVPSPAPPCLAPPAVLQTVTECLGSRHPLKEAVTPMLDPKRNPSDHPSGAFAVSFLQHHLGPADFYCFSTETE